MQKTIEVTRTTVVSNAKTKNAKWKTVDAGSAIKMPNTKYEMANTKIQIQNTIEVRRMAVLSKCRRKMRRRLQRTVNNVRAFNDDGDDDDGDDDEDTDGDGGDCNDDDQEGRSGKGFELLSCESKLIFDTHLV